SSISLPGLGGELDHCSGYPNTSGRSSQPTELVCQRMPTERGDARPKVREWPHEALKRLMTARTESLLLSREARSALSRAVYCSERRSWLSHPKLNPAGKKSYLGWCFMLISVRTPILRASTDNYPSGWRQGSSYFPERRYRPVSVWRTIHSQI